MVSLDTQIVSIIQIALIGILVVLGLFFLWRKIQRLEQKMESLQGMLEHCSLCPVVGGASSTGFAGVAGGSTGFAGSANPEQVILPKKVSAVKPVYEAKEYQELNAEELSYEEADEAEEAEEAEDEAEEEYDEDGDDYGIELNPEEEQAIQRIFKQSLLNSLAGGGGGAETAFMVFNPFGGFNGVPADTVPIVEETPFVQPPIIEEIHLEETDADTTTGTRWTKTKLSKLNVEQLKDLLVRHQLSTEGNKKQLFERALEHLVNAPKTMDMYL